VGIPDIQGSLGIPDSRDIPVYQDILGLKLPNGMVMVATVMTQSTLRFLLRKISIIII